MAEKHISTTGEKTDHAQWNLLQTANVHQISQKRCLSHRVHTFTGDETGLVYLPTAGTFTATLLVMVNVVKGGGRALPPHQPVLILHLFG